MLTVVPISKYCEISGESKDAVTKRIDRGIWLEGKQVVKIAKVKERWIDLDEVEKWARSGGSYNAA